MNTGLIASRYAKALLLYAFEERGEETVYHEMTNVLNSFRQLPQIRSVLGNPVTKNADKVKLMLQMCGGTTPSKAYERFVHTLIDNSREELLMECSRQYIEQYREKKHIYVVRLTTATESDQMTVDRITRLLKNFDHSATVEYEKTVDPGIIGGFVVQVGYNRVDGSVRSQLNEIARNLR